MHTQQLAQRPANQRFVVDDKNAKRHVIFPKKNPRRVWIWPVGLLANCAKGLKTVMGFAIHVCASPGDQEPFRGFACTAVRRRWRGVIPGLSFAIPHSTDDEDNAGCGWSLR